MNAVETAVLSVFDQHTFLIVQRHPQWHKVVIPKLVAKRQDIFQSVVALRDGDFPDAVPER